MAKTYKVSTVEVSAQSRKEWLARRRGKGEVATSAAAVVVQSEASSAPSALDALFRQVNIGTDDAPKYVAEALFPLRIGDALLYWHADQKYLGVEHATESEKANFFATGGVTAGGIGSSSGGSGGGGSSTLAGLNDVALKSAIANDMLVYNGTHWVNTPMSAIKPDLTAYATKSWVEGKGYIAASALDPYAKTADVANTYATKTALQGVDIRVQGIEYIFEKDQDGVINKWQEIVDFLAGVEGDTLDSILDQFATKDSLAGYLPLSGGTIAGLLTIPANNLIVRGYEGGGGYDNIINKTYPDGLWGTKDAPEQIAWSIRNAFAFDWYNDRWIIGSVRHSGADSAGFGIGLIGTKDDGTIYQKNLFRIDKNGEIYQNGVALSTKYLPLSGGQLTNDLTISSSSRLKMNGGIIELNRLDGTFGVLLCADVNVGGTTKNLAIYDKNAWNKVLHSGNYTDYTVPKTGGTFSGNVTAPTFIGDLTGNADSATKASYISGRTNGQDWNVPLSDKVQILTASGQTDINAYTNWARGLSVMTTGGGFQLASHNGFTYVKNIGARLIDEKGNTTSWRALAFTDDNVASATKLQTPRTIWGQSFDGTGDVSGLIENTIKIHQNTSNATLHMQGIVSTTDYIHLFVSNLDPINRSRPLVLQYNYGNVGVGTPNPAEKLEVAGKIVAKSALHIKRAADEGTGFKIENISGTSGYNMSLDGGGSYLSIRTNAGGGTTDTMYVGYNGVGIGTTSPTSELHVVGGARITDSATIEKNLFVDKNIYVAESSSDGGIYFGDDEYAYIKESPDDVMTIASNQGLILRVNHISDEGAVIKLDGPVRIGDAILDWDATNKCITIKNVNTGQKASLVVDGGVTATAIN